MRTSITAPRADVCRIGADATEGVAGSLGPRPVRLRPSAYTASRTGCTFGSCALNTPNTLIHFLTLTLLLIHSLTLTYPYTLTHSNTHILIQLKIILTPYAHAAIHVLIRSYTHTLIRTYTQQHSAHSHTHTHMLMHSHWNSHIRTHHPLCRDHSTACLVKKGTAEVARSAIKIS